MLHTLGFQLTVEHPYSRIMPLLQKLFKLGKGADRGRGADKTLNRQLCQVRYVGGTFGCLSALQGNASRQAREVLMGVKCWTG